MQCTVLPGQITEWRVRATLGLAENHAVDVLRVSEIFTMFIRLQLLRSS